MHAPKSGLSEGAAHGQKRKTEILIDTLRMIFKHALIKCEHIHRNEKKNPVSFILAVLGLHWKSTFKWNNIFKIFSFVCSSVLHGALHLNELPKKKRRTQNRINWLVFHLILLFGAILSRCVPLKNVCGCIQMNANTLSNQRHKHSSPNIIESGCQHQHRHCDDQTENLHKFYVRFEEESHSHINLHHF